MNVLLQFTGYNNLNNRNIISLKRLISKLIDGNVDYGFSDVPYDFKKITRNYEESKPNVVFYNEDTGDVILTINSISLEFLSILDQDKAVELHQLLKHMISEITPPIVFGVKENLFYFGTRLDSAGHYFWTLHDSRLVRSKVYFDDLPFNPESLTEDNQPLGAVRYLKFGDYRVCIIVGSCYDKRPGSKSVFWTTEDIRFGDFKNMILSIPIGKKIIEQMPFEVEWHTIEKE